MDPLDVVRAAYAAWNSGDIDPVLEYAHPDVKWHTSGTFPGLSLLYEGRDGVRRWHHELTAPFERFEVTLVDARVRDDRVTTRVHFDAIGATSRAHVQLDFLNEWRFEQGLVVEFHASPLG